MSTTLFDKLKTACDGKFDDQFIQFMIDNLPKMLSSDHPLKFGELSVMTGKPRGMIGRFMRIAAKIDEWPLDVTPNGSILKKDNAITNPQPAKPNNEQSSTNANLDIIKAILHELSLPPVDDVIGFTFSSIPHLAEVVGAPIETIEEVVNEMTKRGLIKKYDGEIDFEEDVFTLNQNVLEKAKEDAKSRIKEQQTKEDVATETSVSTTEKEEKEINTAKTTTTKTTKAGKPRGRKPKAATTVSQPKAATTVPQPKVIEDKPTTQIEATKEIRKTDKIGETSSVDSKVEEQPIIKEQAIATDNDFNAVKMAAKSLLANAISMIDDNADINIIQKRIKAAAKIISTLDDLSSLD